MIIESATITEYLRQEVSKTEWELRHLLLRLHATTNRINFFRIADDAKTQEFRDERIEIISEMKLNDSLNALPEERRKRLLEGQDVFVNGMRRAALEGMQWREQEFQGVYSYLSGHAHSSPISFMRMQKHQVNPMKPSAAQYAVAGFAISIASSCVARVTLRTIDAFPDALDEFPGIERLRERDRGGPWSDAVSAPP